MNRKMNTKKSILVILVSFVIMDITQSKCVQSPIRGGAAAFRNSLLLRGQLKKLFQFYILLKQIIF